MNFKKFNRWVTLAANIGVVAGIFFLAIELRQSNLATRIAARDSASQGHIDYMSFSVEPSILAVARQKVGQNETLTDLETDQLRRFHALRWRHYERVFFLYQYDVISDGEWQGYENGILRALNGSSVYWEAGRRQLESDRSILSKQFIDYVDSLMQGDK